MFEEFQSRSQKDINTLSEKCREYKLKLGEALKLKQESSVKTFTLTHSSVENLRVEHSNLGNEVRQFERSQPRQKLVEKGPDCAVL